MFNQKTVWIFVLVNSILFVNSAKILGVFPTPSISHQVVFRTLTRELLKHGHEVTVITTDPEYAKGKAPVNFTEIDTHDVSYGLIRHMGKDHKITEEGFAYSVEKAAAIFMAILFEMQLQVPEVKDILLNKSKEFDLVLIEGIVRPAISVSHIFKVPVILVSSFGIPSGLGEVMGAANHPILYPSPFTKKIYELELFEKIELFYKYFSVRHEYAVLENDENLMLQKYFGPEIPPISVLYENVDMIFINIHPIWADNQPTPPSIVYMGGIHQADTKILPKDLQNYLDKSKHGVIYLSFGTNALASMIPKENIEIIATVLSKLPYDVLWKWDQDELPIKSENIKLSKWFPQADLLKHPNIKLFITQAGLQSTDEAITAGVPLVAIPMLGDQWYNAEKYVRLGIGKKILLQNLDAAILKDAVETVIRDESYRNNVKKLRNLMLDQPQKPLDRATWWIEHILRHGSGNHLRPPAANMSWTEYFQFDVIVVVSSVLIILSIIVVCILVNIYKLLSNYLSPTKKIKKN